ncbi:multifunctional aminopeptidase A [Candidatus Magnetoovum chiemensis]|nr:multifunctional aminopeptidase A [Candidatus Magnetoovum chiemensis]
MTEIIIKNITEKEIKTDALILPFYEDDKKNIYSDLDDKIGGLIKRLDNTKEFSGKKNETALLHITNLETQRLCLVGIGKKNEITAEKLRQAAGKALRHLRSISCKDVALSTRIFNGMDECIKGDFKPIYYFLEGGLLSLYRYLKYKTNEEEENKKELNTITILDSNADIELNWLTATIEASNFAKDLINTPAKDMTPTTLSEAAKSLANDKIKVTVLEKEDVVKEGMGAYLSVSMGSDQPLKLIILEYNRGEGAPIVIVGKSVTFDSGGLSIKPADSMELMKHDMGGGAATLAIVMAVSKLELPLNLVAILPATENMLNGLASKPGDVVKTITGKTIEILNTDAEGRLTLADALGYAIKYFKPRITIDIATLTGACIVALGNEALAIMGTDNDMIERFKKAADETSERVWQMPLFDEYKEYIKSDIADVKNTGGRAGGVVTAGCFLKEFTSNQPWIHLDIASTVWNTKDKPYLSKGATGIGVRLILSMLRNLVK